MTIEIIGGIEQVSTGVDLASFEDAVKESLGISSTATEEESTVVRKAVKTSWGAISQFLRYDPAIRERTEIFPVADFRQSQAPGIWEVENQRAYLRQHMSASASELQLSAIPLRSSPAPAVWISYDGRFGTKESAFGAGDKKVEGRDYWSQYDTVDGTGAKLCNDGILRSFGMWPAEPGSIRVVYTAGYTDAELSGDDGIVDASPIMDALIEEALRRVKKAFVLWKKNARTGHNAGTITSEGLGDYNYSLAGGILDKLLLSGGLTGESKEKLQPFVLWGLDK